MPISDKLIDQLLEDCDSPEDILGEAGLLKQLTKKVAERALNAEMEQHLGYAKHAPEGRNSGSSRNGKSSKKVRSVHGEIDLDIPGDRSGSCEPKLIKKGEKQLNGFDDRIISLYARGMTTRDIQAHFEESYGVEVSPTFISQVTNEVLDEVKQWQQRPLDALYPVVYLDCLVVRSRDSGAVQNKSVYLLNTHRKVGIPAAPETVNPAKKCVQFTAKSIWISLVTAAVVANPSSLKRARSSSTALMTELSRCMREA